MHAVSASSSTRQLQAQFDSERRTSDDAYTRKQIVATSIAWLLPNCEVGKEAILVRDGTLQVLCVDEVDHWLAVDEV